MQRKVGLGLRKPFYNRVRPGPSGIPWYEVITENFMGIHGKPKQVLEDVRKNHEIAFHGVSLGVGSPQTHDFDYLKSWKNLIDDVQPIWVSDHLCWTSWRTINSHDLLPVPYTQSMLAHVIEKIQIAQDFLKRKIFLENPSAYVAFSDWDYSEAEFIAEMCKRSGCGLMLDINNLIVNRYNLGFDIYDYLEKIRKCDVRQIHLAGHSVNEKVRIDTHDHPLSTELIDLLPQVMTLFPNANPMIEYDDNIPVFDHLAAEVKAIQNIIDHPKPVPMGKRDTATPQPSRDFRKVMECFWQDLMADRIDPEAVQANPVYRQDAPTPAAIGMTVYNTSYFNRLRDVLKADFPSVYWALEEDFDDLAAAYLRAYPSADSQIDRFGLKFPEFLESHPVETEAPWDLIVDLAHFERAVLWIYFAPITSPLTLSALGQDEFPNSVLKLKPDVKFLALRYPVAETIQSIKSTDCAEIPTAQPSYYLIYRDVEGDISWRQLDRNQADMFQILNSDQSLNEILDQTRRLATPGFAAAIGEFLGKNLEFFAGMDINETVPFLEKQIYIDQSRDEINF